MDDERRATVRLRQLRLYVDNHLHDRYLAPPLALVAAALLTQWVPLWQAALWVTIELGAIATYIAVYRTFLRSPMDPADEAVWVRLIGWAHGAHMLAWSSIVVWAVHPDDGSSLMFAMLVHVGLISLTTVMSNTHKRLFLTDMAVPALALCVPPLLEPTPFNVGLAVLGLLFVGLMLQVGLRIHTSTAEALHLRQHNEDLIRELETLATRDPLTGIANRRHFIDVSQGLLAQAENEGTPLALLIIDVDHFKPINDQHGHLAGDGVLQAVVEACERELRDSDQFGRLGGEEFAIMLPSTPLPAACVVAERLRASVAGLAYRIGDAAVPLSISIGVTMRRPGEQTVPPLLARADRAMYTAKATGRNRVVAHETGSTSTPAPSPSGPLALGMRG